MLPLASVSSFAKHIVWLFIAVSAGFFLGGIDLHGGWVFLANVGAVVIGAVVALVVFAYAGRWLTRDR